MGRRIHYENEVTRVGRIVLFAIALFSSLGWAQGSLTDGVLINADNMYRDMEKRTVRLEGNVQVVFQGQHMSCRRAVIDLKNQRIIAEGNVILTSEKVHIEGDRVDFNYKQNKGLIYKGFMQSGQVVFQGSVIEKVDKDRYLATDGQFTACETCPPGWSFSGRKIDAELGGYARIRRPVFRIAGIPILILPSIIVPLKSARQSGFLVPVPEVSRRGGVGMGQSYFWAINRSQDATITPKWYDKRGLKTDLEYRYVVSDNGHGQLNTSWTEDRAFQRTLEKFGDDTYHNRWYLSYNHYYQMPEQYVQRANLNLVSDLRLPRDFPKEVKGHGDPALENKVSITKSTEDQYFSSEAAMYTNMLKTYPLATNDDAVNRVPEIQYAIKETQLFENGPFFNFNLNYVNFAREKYNYDDVQPGDLKIGPHGEIIRDGAYNPGRDKFRTGQRLDLRPSVAMPFQLWRKLEINPAVQFRETQYRFYPTDEAERNEFSSTAARRYVQTELGMKTEFSGVFGNLTDPRGNRWKHAFSPQVKYSQIPWARLPNHPFFGEYEGLQYSRQYEPISDTEINNPNSGLQFDYEDRTFARRVADFSITNRFTRKTWLNGNPEYRTAVLFKIGQSYDFKEAVSPTPHPWSSIDSLLDARFQHFETVTTMSYNGYARVSNVSTRLKLMVTPQDFFQVAYSRNYTLTDNYLVADEVRNVGLGGGFATKYVDALANVDFLARTFEVQGWKYQLNLKPPGKCWIIKFEHQQVVGSDDPSYKFSMAFDFGGEGKSTFL
jgi:LPS-assembly protein